MSFHLQEAVEILERTPQALTALLSGVSDNWLRVNEGEGTWNVFEVVDHLIEGEKKNWVIRLEWMLGGNEQEPFPAFDRYAHLNTQEEAPLAQRLLEFQTIRAQNMAKCKALVQSESQLKQTGVHPDFGTVTVQELLSTWVVHDLTHLAQITRVMANRYKTDVGPWREYLSILNR